MPAPAKNAVLTRLRTTTAIVTALSLFVTQSVAYALPVGGQVVAGQATISTSPNALTVSQSSNRAIVNWQGFNIAGGETVNVVEPSASSIELERVTGSSNPTQIMGSLSSNGQVWLVNPNGVMFGGSAQVNVAGLVATSSDIDNSSFMNGNYSFTHPGNPNALISNAGSITISDNGLAALVGPNVTNSGLIQARLGKVALASGDTFALDLYGDGLLSLQASSQITQQAVNNSGTINADGGTVLLTAAAAQSAINSVINMTGLIQANSVGTHNGTITLYAEGSNAVQNNVAADKGQKSGSSEVLVSGTLDASGKDTGQTGGNITVTGDHVGILAGSTIDASGDTGGGTIRIGGDFHGQGTTPTAEATIVQSGANILANAINSGSGGNVTVWSDDYTNFAGDIQARGGLTAGNGGFIETSGHVLDFAGTGSASAPNGTAGTWLLDPNNVIINGTATSNPSPFTATWTSTGASNLLFSDIQTFLNAGTNVDITASGTIEVAHNLTKSAGADATLTLAAGTDITIDTGIAIASTVGKLNVVLDADTALAGGAIVINSGSSITSDGGNITMGGGANPLTTAAVGDVAHVSGIDINGGTINAGGGAIVMNGTGYSNIDHAYGISLYGAGAIQTTGSGTITLYGNGGAATGSNSAGYGLLIQGNSLISVANGDMNITGIGGTATGNAQSGLRVQTGSTIQTTGSGTINITGYGGGTGASLYDEGVAVAGATVQSTAAGGGGINLTGYSGDNGGTGSESTYGTDGIFLSTGVISSVSGAIVLDGNTGNGHVVSNSSGSNYYGVAVEGGSAISSTGNATITLNGVGAGSGSSEYGIFTGVGGSSNVIGGASASGNIALNANTVSLTNFAAQTTGNVTIAPTTASTPIGFSGGAGTLLVTQAIMDDINAPTVTIGSLTDTGLLTTGAFVWEHTLNNLNLESGGAAGAVTIGGSITKGIDDGSVANTAGGTLNVIAGADIIVNSNKAISSSSTYGKLNTTFDSDYALGGGGILLNTGSSITSNGGNITLGGQGSPATLDAVGTGSTGTSGVFLSSSTLSAGAGNIIINGSGTAGGYDDGVYIETTNISTTTGNIAITGYGFADGDAGLWGHDMGVAMFFSSQISTVSGGINITGIGYETTSSSYLDHGVLIGGKIISTGTGNEVGAIDINGTGADGGYYNAGVMILEGTTISSADANINIIGRSNGIDSFGVYLGETTDAAPTSGYGGATTISTSGTGSITINAAAGSGTAGSNYGIYLMNASVIETTGSGNVITTGSSSGSGGTNEGVSLIAGSMIGATGTGSVAVSGTGSVGDPSGSDNHGIYVNASSITGNGGNVTLTGTGGTGTGGSNNGIDFINATVSTNGSGNVALTGSAGSGASYGVYIDPSADSTVLAVNGNITVTAPAGGIDVGNAGSSFATTGTNSSGASSIIINTDAISLGGANTIDAGSNGVTIRPFTTSTTIGIAGGAGTLGITSGILSDITADSLTIGSTSGTGNITVGTQTLPANELIQTGSGNIEFSGAQTGGAHSLTVVTTSGNITLDQNAEIASTASGNAIVLAAGGNFINNDSNDGASALSTPDGRWLVYSNNPFDNTVNGLSASFNRYFCTYGGTCPSFPASGDGLLYSLLDFPVTSYTVDSSVNLTAYSLPAAAADNQAKTPISHLLTLDFNCGQQGGNDADAFTVNCQGDNGM